MVELFEWDPTKKWRQVLDKGSEINWMIIEDPMYGILLRLPVGAVKKEPAPPVCSAATQGDLIQLRKFIKEGYDLDTRDGSGHTPLMLAAMRGHLNCIVALLEGGASASLTSRQGWSLSELAQQGMCRALVNALIGEDFDARDPQGAMRDFQAGMRELHPDLRNVAERLQHDSLGVAFARSEQEALEIRAVNQEARGRAGLAPASSRPAPKRGGVMYTVAYKSVPVTVDPIASSEELVAMVEGEVVEVLGYDKTHTWGRVRAQHPEDGEVTGWMPLEDDNIGRLLRPMK